MIDREISRFANKVCSDGKSYSEVVRVCTEYEEQIEALQEDLKHKKIAIQSRKARIKNLERQIEKMKCTRNCMTFYNFKCPWQEQPKGDNLPKSCKGCKEWELKEIKGVTKWQ